MLGPNADFMLYPQSCSLFGFDFSEDFIWSFHFEGFPTKMLRYCQGLDNKNVFYLFKKLFHPRSRLNFTTALFLIKTVDVANCKQIHD